MTTEILLKKAQISLIKTKKLKTMLIVTYYKKCKSLLNNKQRLAKALSKLEMNTCREEVLLQVQTSLLYLMTSRKRELDNY